MGVVDEINRPHARRKAIQAVIDAVAVGGTLLVSSVVVSDVVETATLGRLDGPRWQVGHRPVRLGPPPRAPRGAGDGMVVDRAIRR